MILKNTVFSTEISWFCSILSDITHLSDSFLGPLFIPVLISCGLLCLKFLLMEFYPRKVTSVPMFPFTALSPERTLTWLRSFLALRLEPARLRLCVAISQELPQLAPVLVGDLTGPLFSDPSVFIQCR